MKNKNSYHFILPLMMIFAFSPVLSGCALLLIGGGAAGGYAISKDEVVGAVDAKEDKVYRAAIDVAKDKGIIKMEDETHKKIEAEVNGATVKIYVTRITEKAVQLKVEARNKYKMPKIEIAQDVYTSILKRVA